MQEFLVICLVPADFILQTGWVGAGSSGSAV